MKNFNLPIELIASLERMNILTPTEIQKQAIPLAMEGRDILASSQTGSGKTLAYLLPILNSFLINQTKSIVLVPTRELANQVHATLRLVSRGIKLNSAILIGGEPMMKQFLQLKQNPQIIIGTPGRIIDHISRKSVILTDVKTLVLDEMDRMLDMGMKQQLEEIYKFIDPKQKQVLMFSATIPKHIVELSHKYLNNPESIVIGKGNQVATAISQETINITDQDKFTELLTQLETRNGSIIVFVNTKKNADYLAKMLKDANHKADAIHGDLNQRQRERVILSFRNERSRIMVATDVAARGLDIPHTQHVINYDLPTSPEDYLHRIGRTGRAGSTGNALSFISPADQIRWKAINKLITCGESTSREQILGKKPNDRKFVSRNSPSGSKTNNFKNNYKKPYKNPNDKTSRPAKKFYA